MSAAFVVFVTALFDEGAIPLNYRGAVAYGEFTVEGNFLVGPAVDEAAEAEKRANAAVIYLTDSARSAYMPMLAMPGRGIVDPNRAVLRHSVPMKAPDPPLDTFVVNPFTGCMEPHHVTLVAKGMQKAFGEPLPCKLQTKFDNTMALMKAAEALWYRAEDARKMETVLD